MTGYGRATAALGGGTLTVQVSSVNRRSLDLTVKIPDDWESLEAEVGALVRRVAARGKIHVDVEFTWTARVPPAKGAVARPYPVMLLIGPSRAAARPPGRPCRPARSG